MTAHPTSQALKITILSWLLKHVLLRLDRAAQALLAARPLAD